MVCMKAVWIQGPLDADTDSDGLNDGVEDANRNGVDR